MVSIMIRFENLTIDQITSHCTQVNSPKDGQNATRCVLILSAILVSYLSYSVKKVCKIFRVKAAYPFCCTMNRYFFVITVVFLHFMVTVSIQVS